MADLSIKPRQLVKTLFAPERTEPAGSPGMAAFLRGLVATQSYLILVLLGMTVMVAIVFAERTEYHLVVLDRTAFPKEIKRLVPLDEPNLTRLAIMNMAEHIATRVLTYGFNNADERLVQSKRLFTQKAWKNFVNANLEAGKLDILKRSQQILSSIARKTAVIVSEGVVNEKYQWVVQVPIISSYLAGSDSLPQRKLLTLTLIRAPVAEYPEGVAIDGWVETAN